MDNNESSLFSIKSLTLFGLIVVVALFFLFPGEKLIDDFNKKSADRTSIHYLKALIAKNPTDGQLRLQLANQLLELGVLEEAIAILAPLLNDPAHSNKAQFLSIQIQFQQYFDETDTENKQIIKTQLINAINMLYPKVKDIQSLDLLAQWSQELAEPAIAAKIYQHIVELLDKTEQKHDKNIIDISWMLLGIQNAQADEIEKNVTYYAQKHLQALLAAHQLEEAFHWAKIYVPKYHQSEELLRLSIKIASYSGDAIQSRDWGRSSIALFDSGDEELQQQFARELAANDPKNSLEWVKEFIKKNPVTSPLLAFSAELANSLGEKEYAKTLGLKQLELTPGDPQILDKMVQYELGLKDLGNALKYAQQRVAADENNIEARKQLADVALWAGYSSLAMQQKSWLYQKTADIAFLKDAVKIGKALFLYDEVAQLYTNLSNNRRLTDSELKDYYDVLQETGFADAGRHQLKQYIKKWPQHKQARFYLAKTEELTGEYKAALETLQAGEYAFGRSSELTRNTIELLLKAEDFETAWVLLNQSAETQPPDNSEFWQLYAQTAWILGHEHEAETGYYHLLTYGEIEYDLISRLLQLSSKSKDKKRQLEILLIAWNKFEQPDFLLDAIDLSEQLKNSLQTSELIAQADSEPSKFHNNVRYWMVKARIANDHKRHSQAKHYLLKALDLDGRSVDARKALLWHMIDYGSAKELRNIISTSVALTGFQTELWEPIAAGYRKLGDPHRALPWYARAVQQSPGDYLLLLAYADTLSEAGNFAKAKKYKRYTLTQVRPDLIDRLPQIQPNIEEFMLRYADIVREELGIHSAEKWFSWAQQGHGKKQNPTLKQAVFDEYMITWYLASNQVQTAHRHILRALKQRVELPAWQQMALAVYDNDRDAIEKLLLTSNQLSSTDRVAGLRIIGREAKALAEARNHLNSSQGENTLLSLRKQAADLGPRNPNGFAVTANRNNISELEKWSINSTVALTREINSYWLGYEYVYLKSMDENLIIQPNQSEENNLHLKWKHSGLINELWLQGNAGFRADQNVYGLKAGWQRKIWDGWSFRVEGAYNEISDESAAFRLAGARDRITLGLNGEITKRDYFALNLHGRNYKTRSGTDLGTGFAADLETGYRFRFAQPSINVSLHGIMSKTDLITKLPLEMQAAVGPNRGIESVLADQYQEVGFNIKISDGELRPFGFIEKYLHYFLNMGVFFSSPLFEPGVSVEAGIGMRLFANDDISLIGRYVDIQGGVNSIPTESIELRYSFRFD